MNVGDRRSLNIGVALLAVGIYFVLARHLHFRGPGPLLLLIGTVLLVVSVLRNFRGPVVPAGVLLGLGAGFLLGEPLDRWMPGWATLLLGLGGGLLLAAGLDRAAGRERHPSPLISGVVLIAIALVTALGANFRLPDTVFDAAWRLWPFAVLVAGGILVLRGLRRSG
jgi:hypothetical protein